MKSLSASKVDCFFGCKKLFKYRYIDKLKMDQEPVYFAIGNIVHSALEEFHKLDSNKKKSTRMEKSYKASLVSNNCMERLKKNELTLKDLYTVKEILSNYLKHIRLDLPGKILSVEKKFKINIEGIEVNGKADRIDLVGDEICVIDYKTNSSVLTKLEIKESVQIPTYAIWAKDAFKRDKVRGKYVFVKKLGPRGGGIREMNVSKIDIAKAEAKYKEVWRFINDKSSRYDKNHEYKYCQRCEFKEICIADKN